MTPESLIVAIIDNVMRNTRAWLIGIAIAIVLAIFGGVYHAGSTHGVAAVQRAALKTVLAANTEQLAAAGAVVDSAQHGARTAAAVRDTATHVRAVAATHQSSAHAHVTVTSDTTVAIDGASPTVVPQPVAALLTADDALIRADSAVIRAAAAERDSVMRVAAAVMVQRDLEATRVDTLTAHAADAPAGGCGTACTVKRVAIVTVAIAAAIKLGPAAVRAIRHAFH